MEISNPTQNLWNQLIQNTPNQDPLILIALLSIPMIAVLALAWITLFKNSLTPQKKTDTENLSQVSSQEQPFHAETPKDISDIQSVDQATWMHKLKSGLSRTRGQLVDGISGLFGTSKLDEDLLEELHERLFRADLGVDTADELVEHIKSKFSSSDDAPTWSEVSASLKEKVSAMFSDSLTPINQPQTGPQIILVVGVNGVGKTTSIGKLAAHFMAQDKKVLLCAADTYRAAAIDQLQVWGDRLGCEVIKHQQGSDPASVAYDGVKAAMARNCDILLIDTAGRLHNKAELMEELGKIRRVIGKDVSEAPHETWIVVDSTTGQNAFQQVEAFSQVAPLSGIVVTKLDGTAKGGVVIGITNKFKLPIRYIGVGEQASDLREFRAEDFANSLF